MKRNPTLNKLGLRFARTQPTSFVSDALRCRNRAAPIRRYDAALHITVQARIRPINGPRHQAVLDRIKMDVIDMVCQVFLVPDRMFTISALPDLPFALVSERCVGA